MFCTKKTCQACYEDKFVSPTEKRSKKRETVSWLDLDEFSEWEQFDSNFNFVPIFNDRTSDFIYEDWFDPDAY